MIEEKESSGRALWNSWMVILAVSWVDGGLCALDGDHLLPAVSKTVSMDQHLVATETPSLDMFIDR